MLEPIDMKIAAYQAILSDVQDELDNGHMEDHLEDLLEDSEAVTPALEKIYWDTIRQIQNDLAQRLDALEKLR